MPSLKSQRTADRVDYTPEQIAIIRAQVRAELARDTSEAVSRMRKLAKESQAAPTPELLATGVQAPEIDRATRREHWTKITQLRRLLDEDFIEREVYQAATCWLNDYEVGFGAGQSRDPLVEAISGSTQNNGQLDRQMASLDRIRAARVILGEIAHEMLIRCVADDWSWARVARHFDVDRDYVARHAACGVLKMLFNDTSYGDRLRSTVGHEAVRVRWAAFA